MDRKERLLDELIDVLFAATEESADLQRMDEILAELDEIDPLPPHRPVEELLAEFKARHEPLPNGDPELTPSYHGEKCLGNGEHEGIECCCDECDHYLICFPEYDDPDRRHTYGDRRDFWRPTVRKETCLDCKHRDEKTVRKYPQRFKTICYLYCTKTKRVGKDLRGVRCPYFEKDDE